MTEELIAEILLILFVFFVPIGFLLMMKSNGDDVELFRSTNNTSVYDSEKVAFKRRDYKYYVISWKPISPVVWLLYTFYWYCGLSVYVKVKEKRKQKFELKTYNTKCQIHKETIRRRNENNYTGQATTTGSTQVYETWEVYHGL